MRTERYTPRRRAPRPRPRQPISRTRLLAGLAFIAVLPLLLPLLPWPKEPAVPFTEPAAAPTNQPAETTNVNGAPVAPN